MYVRGTEPILMRELPSPLKPKSGSRATSPRQIVGDSELRYRRLFETAQNGILILDSKTGSIADVNPYLCKMLGYSRQEFLGKKLWEMGAFKDISTGKDAFAALQADKYIRYEDLPLKTKDGHLVQVEFVSNVYVAGGQHVIQCNIRDITARRRAEQASQEGEDQLRTLVSSLEDIIIEMDAQGTYLNVWTGNPSLLAKPKSEMLGRPASEILGQELAARVMEASARVLAGAHYEDIEYPLDVIGGRRWFLARISPVPAADGVARTVCMLVRDTTDASQARTLQDAVYRIAAAAETTASLDDLYPQIHEIISSVMPAENFYITIYDAARDLLQFPYFKDVDDQPFIGGIQPGKGLTAYVLRTGRSLLCTQAVHDDLEHRGEVKLLGVPSAIWLGVPLMVEGKAIGAMVVQHYSDPNAYGEREQQMLEFVSTQVALAISRKQGEETLRAAEEKYRAMFENAIDGVFQSTLAGRFLTVNPTFARMLGYASPQDMIDTVTDIGRQIYLESPRRAEFVSSMAEHGSVNAFEFQMRRKDGGTLWVSENVRAVRDPERGLLYYEGTVVDITTRKRTEAERLALLEIMQGLAAAQELPHFLEHMRQSLTKVLYAENLCVIFHNKNTGLFEEVFAVDKYDAPMSPAKLEKSVTAYVFRTGEPLLLTPAKFEELITGGQVNLVGTRPASWLGAPLKTPSETIGVIAVQNYEDANCYSERDREFIASTGAQVALAIQRRRAEEALRDSEARFRAVTESANDAVISADGRGNIVGWNPAAGRMFGYSSDEACGQPLSLVMPSSFHEAYRAGMASVAAGREPDLTGKSTEGEGRRKDGTQFPLDMSLSVWQIAGNRFYTAIIRDITERQQARDELQHAKEALETTNRQLQDSLAREENLARKDALTGVRNRFNFDELAALEFHAAVRYQRTLSVMMLDADNLKGVNDSLGHAAGDKALVLLAQAAAIHRRATDVLARYGGDEFILLLPETTAQQALVVAERIRASAATLPVGPSDQPVRLTLSIGIAELQREPIDESIDRVIQRADKALYRAKTRGRNRAVLFDSGMEDEQSAARA